MKKRGITAKYDPEIMAAAIKDYETTELSQQEVCDKHKITLGPFKYAWKKYKEEMKNGEDQQ